MRTNTNTLSYLVAIIYLLCCPAGKACRTCFLPREMNLSERTRIRKPENRGDSNLQHDGEGGLSGSPPSVRTRDQLRQMGLFWVKRQPSRGWTWLHLCLDSTLLTRKVSERCFFKCRTVYNTKYWLIDGPKQPSLQYNRDSTLAQLLGGMVSRCR